MQRDRATHFVTPNNKSDLQNSLKLIGIRTIREDIRDFLLVFYYNN